jgi:hypothetical protein
MVASLALGPSQHHLHQTDPFHLSEYSRNAVDLSDNNMSYYDAAPGLGELHLHHTGPHRGGPYTPSPSDDSHCESPNRVDALENSILNNSYLTPNYHVPLQVYLYHILKIKIKF